MRNRPDVHAARYTSKATMRADVRSRRGFVRTTMMAMLGTGAALARSGRADEALFVPYPSLKALVFDVFGTVVDWRTSVTLEVQEFAKKKSLNLDAAKFTDAWRAGYGPSMARVRS